MQKTHLLRTFTTGVIAICLSFHLTGCAVTPLNHVGVFSQASADLAKNTADAYVYVNETTIQRKINDVAAMGDTVDENTFEGLIAKSDLATRISLLRGVEDYSKALGNLATADFRKEIDAASKDLYGSLGELQNTYEVATKEKSPLSGDNLAIIATAIDAIGTVIAENKRCAAIKKVVTQTDPVIQKSMTIVSNELPTFKEFLSANLDTIWTENVKAYQKEVKTLSFDKRVEKLSTMSKAYERMSNASVLYNNLGTASTKIAKAHTALLEAVTDDKFTTAKLVKEIKNVVEISKSIKEFHDKLLSENQVVK